jgi:broad specificity phosphatase PhoE
VADPPRLTGVEGSLALVRHGQSTCITDGRFQGRSDPPLSPAGTRQAALVGARLRDPAAPPALPLPGSAPVGIWHSPLRRAAATAEAVAAARDDDVPLHADPGLVELAQGAWEGLTHAAVRERFGAELDAWRADPVHHHAPGGEPLRAAATRARAALGPILDSLAAGEPAADRSGPVPGYGSASTAGSWAIVVAHDGILRLLLMTLLGVPLERYWGFPFELCAVSVIELRRPWNRLRGHNLAEHLAAVGGPSPDTARPDGPL